MKNFCGNVLFLDRADINTDEIIPARYLTEDSKEALGPYLLEDLVLEGFNHPKDLDGKRAVVSRDNFGCGSSREHAPWALEVNDINIVVASGFARIFRRNMFNCGMLAIELPQDEIDMLFTKFGGQKASLETDFNAGSLSFSANGETVKLDFELAPFDRALVEAGGWIRYAETKY